MAFRIVGVSVPGPGDVLGTARSVAGWGARTLDTVAALPERTEALLSGVERLIGRIDALSRRADDLVARVDAVAAAAEATVRVAGGVAADAAGVVGAAGQVARSASTVVGQAADASRSATELLVTVEPLTRQALPLATTFVSELSEAEVVAAVRLVDQLPRLAEHLETDIMPILATLDRVGPDINELLDVVKDLRGAVGGIPGLAYLRRRNANSGP